MGSRQTFAPIAGRSNPAVQVIGLHELDNTLSLLSGEIAGPAMRSGLGAAATKIKRVVRANVNATTIVYSPESTKDEQHPASVKRAARQTIGHHIKKNVRAGYLLRVGFGVGIRGAKRLRRQSAGKTAGIGISAQNIHWFVLGTHSSKRPGDIWHIFQGVLRNSVRMSSALAVNTLRKKVWERVRIIAARKRKKAWAASMTEVGGIDIGQL